MKYTMLLAAIAMLVGFGAFRNGSSESSPSKITAEMKAPPPNVTASWINCQGSSGNKSNGESFGTGCRYCCLMLKSSDAGPHEWELHYVLPQGQIAPDADVTKTTSGNVWGYGVVDGPTCFVIKHRKPGGQWHTSPKFCPPSRCCYP